MDFSAGKHLRLPSFPHDEWYILQVWAIAKYLIVTRMMASWLILFVARSVVSFRTCCDQNGNRSCIWDKNNAFRLFGADFWYELRSYIKLKLSCADFNSRKSGHSLILSLTVNWLLPIRNKFKIRQRQLFFCIVTVTYWLFWLSKLGLHA